MECSLKKHEGIYKAGLCELPDELLVHILSFLPIKDAVRTVLLQRFGKLWTLLTTLKFDYSDDDIVCNVMKYHKSPLIEMLELQKRKGNGLSVEDMLNFIRLAVSKKTQVLNAHFEEPTDAILPPCVLRSECLVSLQLTGFVIELSSRVYMGSPRTLYLAKGTMSDDTFKDMISGCPCLQELTVMYPVGLEKLHVTNPSIEKFELDLLLDFRTDLYHPYSLDCPYVKILHIKEVILDNLKVIDVSSVREAKFDCCFLCHTDDDQTAPYFEKLLKKF